MPSLRSTSSSPISEVPYDILREIFHHCLSQYPLETTQPNTTVAPMLLCQICSSWRAVALGFPFLWSHLSCCITAKYFVSEYGSWAVRRKDIDFIMWWKRNQGAMAPFLRLEINRMGRLHQELSSGRDELAPLLRYVTSAQYLQIASESWDWMKLWIHIINEVVFPNLHTLVTKKFLGIPILARTPSLLRRLTVYGNELDQKAIILQHWSALTHLLMEDLVIPLNFWFSLIQAVPDLQWAYFEIDGIYNAGEHTEPSAKYVLPHLSTLFMNYTARGQDDDLVSPFTSLLSPLHLPTLRTLSLYSRARENHPSVSELYTVLQSTPAITTLVLRGDRSPGCLYQIDYPISLAAVGDVEPIWGHVPHLTHLQIDLPKLYRCSKGDTKEILDTFVRNIFLFNGSWLALELPGCPIQTVTFIDIIVSNRNFNTIKSLTMSNIRKRAGGVSTISFKVISLSEVDTGEQAWVEWSLRNY